MPVENKVIQIAKQEVLQSVPHDLHACHILLKSFSCHLAGSPESYGKHHILRPGPHSPLLSSPMDQVCQVLAIFNEQCPHALWRIEFVSGHTQKIRAQLVHIHRYLAHGLGSVRVEGYPVFPGYEGNLSDGLQGPGLIVGQHNGNEGGMGLDRPSKLIGIHLPKTVYREDGHLHTQLVEK